MKQRLYVKILRHFCGGNRCCCTALYTKRTQDVDAHGAAMSDMRRSTGEALLYKASSEGHKRRLPRLLSGDSGSDDAGAPVGTPSAADGLRRLALWGPADAAAPALPKTFNIRCAAEAAGCFPSVYIHT